MSVLAAIGVLALLILVHEAGHFLAARLQGIRVSRFSLGFGPVLWRYQGSETEYSLRALPLGGYVAFPDDDPEIPVSRHDPDLMRNRPVGDRAIVISAGVVANLLFAYLILVLQAATWGIPTPDYQPGVVIPQIASETSRVARQAGIEAGDVVLAVDGRPLGANPEAVKDFVQVIKTSPGRPVRLMVQRQTQTLDLTVVPEATPEGEGKIGVQLSSNVQVRQARAANPVQALVLGAEEFQRLWDTTVQGFGQLARNFQATAQQVAGPVAIVAMGADIARANAGGLIQFAALISINLAIINTLPLPALDGGQLVFLFLEALRGRPLPSRVQEGVMQTGLVLLLGLGLFLIIRDTARLVGL
ncbi:MAG: RIP metalloprotease RseP [Gloeomargaritaceae cyanobacterium C42_A2020_066]|nr:RIP metalloprotease RseP [Gloeomargaritaceae cyanobacterium C42_A2020_066]